MLSFHDLSEAVATMKSAGIGNIGTGGDDYDGDGDEEDEEWDSHKKGQVYTSIFNWLESSRSLKDILRIFAEALHEKEPYIEVRWSSPVIKIEWYLDYYEQIDDKLRQQLKTSDIWKPLQTNPSNLWGIIDKQVHRDVIAFAIMDTICRKNLLSAAYTFEKEHRDFILKELKKYDIFRRITPNFNLPKQCDCYYHPRLHTLVGNCNHRLGGTNYY